MELSQLYTTKYKDIPSFTSIIVAFPPVMIDHWHISAYLTLLFGWFCACDKLLQSCPTLCDSMDCSPPGSSVHGDSPGKNTVGCHLIFQGTFLLVDSKALQSLHDMILTVLCPTSTNLGDWKKACMFQSCSAYRSHYRVWYFCLREVKKKNGYMCN